MDERDPEQSTQEEIREEAGQQGDDPVTRREALETHLMDEEGSGAGEAIGEPTP